MADATKLYISQVSMGDKTYNIKDTEARKDISDIKTGIAGGTHFIGITSTEITDGKTISELKAYSTNSLKKLNNFIDGDIVIYKPKNDSDALNREFIWSNGKWSELGSTGSLKALAYKADATSGKEYSEGTHTHTVTVAESKHKHSIPSLSVTTSATYTPSGTVGITNSATTPSTLNVGSGTTILTSDDFLDLTNLLASATLTGSLPTSKSTNVVMGTSTAGSMFTATVAEGSEVLVLTAGVAPTLNKQNIEEFASPGTAYTLDTTTGTTKTLKSNITSSALVAKFTGTQATISPTGSTKANNTGETTISSQTITSGTSLVNSRVTVS